MEISQKLTGDTSTPVSQASSLETLSGQLLKQYQGIETESLLQDLIKKRFCEKIAVVTSFGADSAVLLHLVSQISKNTPVIFLETGKHFAQTLSYRDRLTEKLGLTDVRSHVPNSNDLSKLDPDGSLWTVDPDQCCHFRKVLPLVKALKDFDVWITGRKKFQSIERSKLELIETDGSHIKVNPLAFWTEDDVSNYIDRYHLPLHPLVPDGYPSIGCAPCTRPVETGQSNRSGRWADTEKTECGIHKAMWAR